jgi:hypothetical protein
MTHAISLLFDDREALARDGEIEQTESYDATISDAEWRRRTAEADATLKQNGYDDKNAKPLDADGESAPSQDLMSTGRRLSVKANAKRPEQFLDDAALHNGAELHTNPEASIDAKRKQRVKLERYYKSCTEPCVDDAHRRYRIAEGMRLIVNARSELELEVIAGAIHRDCKLLDISTAAELAVAMGCSTSTVYCRLKDGSLTSAIVAIAAEKEQSISEARQSRGLTLDIRRATKGTKFDSAAWHREIEKLYVSLKYEIMNVLARETTLSRFDAQKGSDRALKMLPQSRIDKLAEMGLLTPENCRMLGKFTEADRDEWLVERDAEYIAELCGDADQRRNALSRYSAEEYQRRIKAYLVANGRRADGPVLPKPNVPAPTRPRKKKSDKIAPSDATLMSAEEIAAHAAVSALQGASWSSL